MQICSQAPTSAIYPLTSAYVDVRIFRPHILTTEKKECLPPLPRTFTSRGQSVHPYKHPITTILPTPVPLVSQNTYKLVTFTGISFGILVRFNLLQSTDWTEKSHLHTSQAWYPTHWDKSAKADMKIIKTTTIWPSCVCVLFLLAIVIEEWCKQ